MPCSSHPCVDCNLCFCWKMTTTRTCSSHPCADCNLFGSIFQRHAMLAVHTHAQIATPGGGWNAHRGILAVHIHPQIVTAISCVQQVYPTLSIEQPGNMDMIIGLISEEIRQHSCDRLFPFLFTLNSHIVAAPHDKIFFTVFVVFSFYVSRISGHSVCHCTHIPGHHPILLAYHLQLQTDFYAVEQVLLRNA